MTRMEADAGLLHRLAAGNYAAFAEHFTRQSAESGRDGQPLFMPFDVPPDYHAPDRRARVISRWETPVGQPNWLVNWAIFDGARIVAHIDLDGAQIASQQHRATLGIGVEQAYQRRGYGTRLMDVAISFAQAEALAWLDLYVFAHNTRAIALYRKFGFVETGRRADCFRVQGTSVEDVWMSLRL